MKRTAIILSLILGLSHIGFAQRDTIGAGYPFYFPQPLNYDSLQYDCITNYNNVCNIWNGGQNNILPGSSTELDSVILHEKQCNFLAIKYVPDTDIHIIGIAYGFSFWPLGQLYPYGDSTTQVVMLFVPEGDTLLLIDSVAEVVITDSTYRRRLLDYDFTVAFNDSSLIKNYDIGQSFRDYWTNWRMNTRGYVDGPTGFEAKYFGIKESYFQNEINLSQGDTFYIAASWRRHHGDNRFIPHALTCQPLEGMGLASDLPIPIFLPSIEYSAKDTNDVWYHGLVDEGIVPWVWAIIRRDCDSCPQVRELQHFKASANKAFFRWQRGTNHHDWQLSYGPVGTAPEDGTIVDYTVPQSGLITLDPDSHYVVYVRARCKFARYEYGPWSAPYTFSINGGNGIEEVSPNEVTLTPNPAADHVTVAAEGMERVELIGVDGTVLLRRDCHGECQIDLTGLAAGLYLVRATTPRGTTTRRLVVQ